jgi:hypothetical protein
MDSRFLRFYTLFGLLVVGWLYGFEVILQGLYESLNFQDRLDILLEMSFSGASEQGYTMFYVNSQQMIKSISAGWS